MTIPGTPSAIEATRTVEFRLAVDFQLNEFAGKTHGWCGTRASYTGKSAQIVDRFDDLLAEDVDTRNGDTRNTDIDVERRYIHKPKRQNVAPLIDPDDMMQTPIDLKSPIAMQTAKAIRRAQDRRWFEGFYGNAYTGETGATAVPFKSANIGAVDLGSSGTPAGITKNKLILMRELIATRLVDLDEEMPIVPVTAKQISDLLKINEVTSRDYNPQTTLALQSGKVAEFMGFRFVPMEYGNSRALGTVTSLTVDGSGYRRVPVFVPSGMHWGSWKDFEGDISQRKDKNMSWQIYAETCGTAVRVNEDKCFQMLCLES